MLPRCCCCALAAALLLLLKLKRQEEQAGRRSGGKRAAAGELRDPSLGGVVDWWQESGSRMCGGCGEGGGSVDGGLGHRRSI